jgi:hypothetical protein
LNSGHTPFSRPIFQNRPSIRYGGSWAQSFSTMSIDSSIICGRSSAWPTSNSSRSLISPPGPMPMMKRP